MNSDAEFQSSKLHGKAKQQKDGRESISLNLTLSDIYLFSSFLAAMQDKGQLISKCLIGVLNFLQKSL